MNKKIAVIIGIFLLFVLAIGAFAMMKKTSPQTSGSQVVATVSPNNPASGPESVQGTLKSLLSGGKSVKCMFTNENDSTKTSGTIYVANGQMRGDFQAVVAGKTTNSHMIIDSQYSYVWTDISNNGFKFAVNNQPTAGSAPSNQSVNLDQPLNYSCQGWNADRSLFTLPSNITFNSFTVPTPVTTDNSTASGQPSSVCSACDNIRAGADRDACKTQFNCP